MVRFSYTNIAFDYYPFGMLMPGRSYSSTAYKYGFNGKEKDDEVKGSGNSLDFGARMYDSRLGRWLSIDQLAKQYPFVSPYIFVLNTPIQAKDPDGKRVYFVGGAGNDNQGWNYIGRFNKSWTNLGIHGFTRIDASHGKAGDVLFTNTWRNNLENGDYSRSGITHYAQNDEQVKKAVNDIVNDITSKPLAEGEQLNLAGYSYGSVVQANVAIALINKGYKVDNLVLIGSPTEEGSQLMESLIGFEKEGKIGKIIRKDIPGDHLSNPSGELEFIYGGFQNRKDSGPHFDLARPDDPATKDIDEGKEADKKIDECGQELKNEGVK
jgi:RHS repeat-associated protein